MKQLPTSTCSFIFFIARSPFNSQLTPLCCESCSSHSQVSLVFLLCVQIKSCLSHSSFLCQFKISSALLITHSFIPFTQPSSHSFPRRRRAGTPGEHPHYGGDSTPAPVLQTYVLLPIYLERYHRPWSVPTGGTLKLSYAVECGKKSRMTYT